ncbi:MAG: family 10 glycosylhydrolase, partial [Muribaculaceae bacterium]|nr:family 10 glycosylhydrolase [Muribaculaceae bacterium]
MKKLTLIIIALLALTVTAQTVAVKREARGVWLTAYLSEWPSGAITATNANTMKKACQKMLDTLAVNNMNVVYFHVRAMCDALYNSAYEPWSSYCSSSRCTPPAFDPLEFIVDEAHKRGIELYAWVNPYRYMPKTRTTWGTDSRNYENSHPEWLMKTDYETILNPGIPEVRQRVVDVCQDIITKYDVDGLVFDDYFYNQDNPSFTLDAVQYNAYRAAGGTLGQADWRRENVNQMVHDVNQMVKQTKPWVRFGISPAGVACSSPTVAAQYGVDPSPGNDWQYNQIYSDPMAWISRGTIDFVSPQVYWNTSGNYDEVTDWWGMVGHKFNRHVYISGYAVEASSDAWSLPEYLLQVNVMRQAMTSGVYGLIYFRYNTWRTLSQTIDGRVTQLRHYLKRNVFTTPAIMPVPAWLKPDRVYTTVSNVRLDGDSLRWSPEQNVRYVVYAIPDGVTDAQFRCQPEYMLGISYSPAYGIDAAHRTGYRYAVTILDRWENEYAPVMLGATPQAVPKPTIMAPADGANVSRLGKLQWTAPGASLFTVEVYSDAGLTQQVTRVEVDSTSLPVTALQGLALGGRYWWSVVASGVNLWDNASETRSFVLGGIAIT